MELKYIIFDEAFPVIFPKGIDHNRLLVMTDTFKRKPTSAGFCMIYSDSDSPSVKVSAYGESISLGIGSKPEDAEIILTNLKPKNT